MSSKNFCFEMMKNVTELVIFYNEILQIKDKTIVNKIPEDLPLIYADRDRFEQVIINIVENAVKYANDETEIVIDAEEFNDEYLKNSSSPESAI